MPQGLQTLLLIVFPALAIVAALSDATTMTIPNWISAALVLAFFPTALAVGLPAPAIGLSVALCLGALVAGMAMFALHWIGGGDAKLFAASALWLGMAGAAPFLVWTAIAGGALALALLGARRWASDIGVPFRPPGWMERLLAPEGDIPYGIAIAAGALAAFPQSGLVLAFHGA
ncbi:MAG: pilus assembly protein CpaA [Caulobacterales bacterium 32-69-10]|nr:MAG: pilus assembly protein CpaA [Caulobacterales bacterium 32-69-10]